MERFSLCTRCGRFAIKLNYAVKGLSFNLQMLPGWKATIFDASGVTVSEFVRGKAPWLTNLTLALVFAHVLFVVIDLALFAFATSSSDPVLGFHNVRAAGTCAHVVRRLLMT